MLSETLTAAVRQNQCMSTEPVHLDDALGSFDALWSPRIVTQVNDYDVRIAKIRGEFVWHAHPDTDEFFHVLDGAIDITMRDASGQERVVHLTKGSVFTVPRGVEHKPSSADGASILMFEPTGTLNTGDSAAVPDHIRPSTGNALGSS